MYRPGIKNANADALSRNPVLAEGEINPDLPRHELYELADQQVLDSPDEEAGAPPGRVFRARATRKRGQTAGGKFRISASSSENSSNRAVSKRHREDNALIYKRDEILAVRNEFDGYFICRALHDVYHGDDKVKIQWFTENKNQKHVYAPDYRDAIWFDCILTSTFLKRMDKNHYALSAGERTRIEAILRESIEFRANPPAPEPPKLSAEFAESSDSDESMKSIISAISSSSGDSIIPSEVRPYIKYVAPSDRETRGSQNAQITAPQKIHEPSNSSSDQESIRIPPSGKIANAIDAPQTFTFPRNLLSQNSSLPKISQPHDSLNRPSPSKVLRPTAPEFHMPIITETASPPENQNIPGVESSPAKASEPQSAMIWPWSGNQAKKKLRVNIEGKDFAGKGGVRIDCWETNSTAASLNKRAPMAVENLPRHTRAPERLVIREDPLEALEDAQSMVSISEIADACNTSAFSGKNGSSAQSRNSNLGEMTSKQKSTPPGASLLKPSVGKALDE